MKFPVAYYLLMLYVTVMLKPFMPLLSDAWDHTFAETIHIATVHAQYGANHVEKAMADAGADSNGKTQNTVKTAEPVAVHINQPAALHGVFIPVPAANHNRYQLYNPPPVFLPCNYPPPKFSC